MMFSLMFEPTLKPYSVDFARSNASLNSFKSILKIKLNVLVCNTVPYDNL